MFSRIRRLTLSFLAYEIVMRVHKRLYIIDDINLIVAKNLQLTLFFSLDSKYY